MKEIRLLRADEIEVKVKQVTAKGAVLLLYKTARVDMDILDETFGKENWTDDYREIGGVLYCGIGIRSNQNDAFVWKWSNGIESREDGGNEKKGEASDAFKRAGFMVGIGRELYTSPFIVIRAETEQDGKSWKLKDRLAKFKVEEITYTDDRKISNVVISDRDGNIVFGAKREDKKQKKEPLKKEPSPSDYSTTPVKTQNKADNSIDEEVVNDILSMASVNGLTDEQVMEWIKKKFGKEKLLDLTIDEANALIRAITKKKETKVA